MSKKNKAKSRRSGSQKRSNRDKKDSRRDFRKESRSGPFGQSDPRGPMGQKKRHGKRTGPKLDAPSDSQPYARDFGKKSSKRPREESSDRSSRAHLKPLSVIQDRVRKHTGGAEPSASQHRSERSERRDRSHFGNRKVLKATVDKNRKGFAFLLFEDKKLEDAFVPAGDAAGLFPGDRVEVVMGSRGRPERIRVIAHRFREVVGRFTPHPVKSGMGGWVTYERKRTREEIFIPEVTQKIKMGDWIRAKLHFHEKGQFKVTGEILDVYGDELPPSADLPMIAAEYNLVEEHTAAAEQEAADFPKEVTQFELGDRVDLRNIPFITIDGETARDFDDAVYVEPSAKGFYLWVAIADVSYYVQEGSHLDKDAQSRGTSVYFPERAFHMLPRALSENLCSLKPNVPRFALVSKIEFDSQGNRLNTEMMEALIQSQRRATYNEIQKEWEANQKESKWEYSEHFKLYQILRKARNQRGSIDFELPEAEIVAKPTGEVVSIAHRPRLDAHRLIEEFMIAANEAVTDWMMKLRWPFVYRVHDEPSEMALQKFQKLAGTVGISVSFSNSASPKVMADLVKRLEGHPAQTLLNMALLRSMKQAIYTSTHGIHFGLASEGYTHFTSPIRRYPDLVVHRLIRMVLRMKKKHPSLRPDAREKLEKELAEICEHCSYRERLASDAERESIKLKQVRAILHKLGEDFDGNIVGMVDSGLFVQVSDPYVEGMVTAESMSDDTYEFNEERMTFSGRRKKKTFKIGDPIRVKAVRADLDRRQIDFVLVNKL